MTEFGQTRGQAVAQTIAMIRRIETEEGISRGSLDGIREVMTALAVKTELWGQADFPAPEAGERQARYLIAVDDDQRFALYLNVMRPGKTGRPHNHTTWACIAGVEGTEQNYFYERLDNGSVAGKARIREVDHVAVNPGDAIALLADDIHSVQITGDRIVRHLHMYGRALETLTERLSFDMEAGTCGVMRMDVKTR